ncbi:hypothetical protein NKH77_15935 [Streptomyces sp. M19]
MKHKRATFADRGDAPRRHRPAPSRRTPHQGTRYVVACASRAMADSSETRRAFCSVAISQRSFCQTIANSWRK